MLGWILRLDFITSISAIKNVLSFVKFNEIQLFMALNILSFNSLKFVIHFKK